MKRIFSIFLVLSILLTGCGGSTSNSTEEKEEDDNKVVLPLSVEEIKETEVDDIVEELEKAGFTDVSVDVVQDLDPDEYDVKFINEITINSKEAKDNQKYDPDAKIVITSHEIFVKYTLDIVLDCESNLLFDKYDVDVYFDDEKIDTIKHGKKGTYSLRVKEGDHHFTLYKSDTEKNEAVIDLDDVKSDIEASYSFSCESKSIDVTTEYIDRKVELDENQIKMTCDSSDYENKNYEDVVNELENLGFTNVTTQVNYDIYFGWTEEGSVSSVTVSGESFNKADIFDKTAPIVVTYSSNVDNDPENKKEEEKNDSSSSKVSYSTNTKDTVKNGNSGVYSYIREMSGYDLYWIIDFDEGYVYNFRQGDGSTCDRVKIDSGTLNDHVLITYHDGSDTWQEALYFKYENQPDTLIWEDYSHETYKYTTTNLTKALSLKSTKTIIDY